MANKFASCLTDIHAIFDSVLWSAESIKTFPANFIGSVPSKEYIRLNIIMGNKGVNRNSVSGLLNIDIFVPAGAGPSRVSLIADRLDAFLVAKSKALSSGVTQFHESTLANFGQDRDNASLYRAIYSIPFDYNLGV